MPRAKSSSFFSIALQSFERDRGLVNVASFLSQRPVAPVVQAAARGVGLTPPKVVGDVLNGRRDPNATIEMPAGAELSSETGAGDPLQKSKTSFSIFSSEEVRVGGQQNRNLVALGEREDPLSSTSSAFATLIMISWNRGSKGRSKCSSHSRENDRPSTRITGQVAGSTRRSCNHSNSRIRLSRSSILHGRSRETRPYHEVSALPQRPDEKSSKASDTSRDDYRPPRRGPQEGASLTSRDDDFMWDEPDVHDALADSLPARRRRVLTTAGRSSPRAFSPARSERSPGCLLAHDDVLPQHLRA